MKSHYTNWGIHFSLTAKKERIAELQRTMEEPGFWDNPEESQKIMKELRHLEDVVKSFESLENQYEEIQILIEMGYEENDPEVLPEIEESLKNFSDHLEEMIINP